MLRYRLLAGFIMAFAFDLAFRADGSRPLLEHYAFAAVIIAAFAGAIMEKHPAPKVPNVKSFRLLKGADKW
jgi:hypothetical protein